MNRYIRPILGSSAAPPKEMWIPNSYDVVIIWFVSFTFNIAFSSDTLKTEFLNKWKLKLICYGLIVFGFPIPMNSTLGNSKKNQQNFRTCWLFVSLLESKLNSIVRFAKPETFYQSSDSFCTFVWFRFFNLIWLQQIYNKMLSKCFHKFKCWWFLITKLDGGSVVRNAEFPTPTIDGMCL